MMAGKKRTDRLMDEKKTTPIYYTNWHCIPRKRLLASLPLYFFCYYLLSSSRVGYLVGYLLFLIPGCYDLFGYVYRCCYIIALRSLDAIYFHVTYDEIYTPLRPFPYSLYPHVLATYPTVPTIVFRFRSPMYSAKVKSNQITITNPSKSKSNNRLP